MQAIQEWLAWEVLPAQHSERISGMVLTTKAYTIAA
jgi:hypothetical protein